VQLDQALFVLKPIERALLLKPVKKAHSNAIRTPKFIAIAILKKKSKTGIT